MFDAAFIDEIRYDRKLEYGFAASWDQASHLITTFPAIRTSAESFNFVFLNPQDGEQWEFLYSRLPMLLYYAIEVVEALIARLLPHPELLADTTSNRREIGYMLWTSLGGADLALESDAIPLPPCPQCGLSAPMDKANMLSYYTDLKITCRGCGTVNAVPDQANQDPQERNTTPRLNPSLPAMPPHAAFPALARPGIDRDRHRHRRPRRPNLPGQVEHPGP